MGNEVPGWTDDGTLSWSPARELSFTPEPAAPRIGPWSPPAVEKVDVAEESSASLYWPWRIGLGLSQGLGFYFLFHARALGQWPGSDPFLFDAIALPLLLVPCVLMAGLGRIPLVRLLAFAVIAAAILAGLGWYHRWRIFGIDHGEPGLSMLVLSSMALFIAHSFAEAWQGGRLAYARLFDAGWTLAARFCAALLALGLCLALMPLLPRLTLESGDILAMPLLGLGCALAFQLTAALPRFTAALRHALIVTATIALPLATATALLMLSTTLASGPPALLFLLALMATLVVAISAAHRDGMEQVPVWRENLSLFASVLLLALGAIAAWVLAVRAGALGWTGQRLFAAAALSLLGAYGIGYSFAGLAGLMRGRGVKGFQAVNIALGAVAMLGALALASPLADPLRWAAATQAARLEQGAVAVEKFDFANLPRDRFGRDALAALSHSLYPDIARAAQEFQKTVRGVVHDPLNPTEVGANIGVHTPGGRLPAALLARDWHAVTGAPPCLTTASESCDAYFLDLNNDGRQEILLVTGSETRWWGAVLQADDAGRWSVAGRLAAGCGATLSDLRAGHFSVLSALPGWNHLSVAGTRLSVTPSGTGCSHY